MNSTNLASGSAGCKFTFSDDVAIIDSANAYTYTTGPLSATCKTRVTTTTAFTEIAVKYVSGSTKIIVSGGVTGGSNAYQFSNSGTTCNAVTPAIIPFINPPISAVTTACYSGDGSIYAFGSSDFKMWVFNDTTNN